MTRCVGSPWRPGVWVAIASIVWTVTVPAAVKLPAVFGEHMVLQQGRPAPVWGWAEPGETVTVAFAGQEKTATAAADGRWQVGLDALPASTEPRALTVRAPSQPTPCELRDVLVGEVWICSGQSNMVWPVSAANDAAKEVATATFPRLRLFSVNNRTALAPQPECEGKWAVCAPETVPAFSAVGYFFGRHLHVALNVPVGLINTSWGGTIAEAWTSAEALRARLPEFN